MKNLSELLNFFEKIGQLKKIKRTGWLHWGVNDAEHVSDHAFRMAVMAMFFAKHLKCNELKLVKLALAHDLHESICGDLTLDYSKYIPEAKGLSAEEKEKLEWKAMEELCSLLDKKTAKEFRKLWIEAEQGKTREAKIVRELDKLEMLLQASEYDREKNYSQPLFRAFLETTGKQITERKLKAFLGKIAENAGKV